jgi:tRNA threonylcarbamoyladenosine biosynthesis protein TsaB
MGSGADSDLSTAHGATLLALDTSTERISIALAVGSREWLHEAAGGAAASTLVLPAIAELLQRAGITVHALDAIAFGRGPGAFTGVRTACSVVQGLAFGAKKPVLPLDTLQVVAEDARLQLGVADIWVAMDARMEEVYAAHYVHVGARWQMRSPPALYTIESLNARWQAAPALAVAGNAVAAFGVRLHAGTAQTAAQAWPSPRALLHVARTAWAEGSGLDAALALPLYLRDKVALTTVERDALKAAKGLVADTGARRGAGKT